MSLRLEGKVAFVTGAAQGIGRAIAEKMAREGASVVVADLLEGAGARAASQIAASGLSAMAVRTDITDEDSVRAAVEATLNRFGQLDILVNNAGTTFFYDATKMTSSEWDAPWASISRGPGSAASTPSPSLSWARESSSISRASTRP
ncbi:MAG: SDR family NAD(P)-dependent oxidoreductase [Truepera sp.]|nr:SDR family NAD(P)-dependent oxidoreductase [Truepera sp.]